MSEIKLLPCPFCGATFRRNYLGNGEHDKNECVLDGFEIPLKWSPLWNTRKPMQEIVDRLETEKRIVESNGTVLYQEFLIDIDEAIQIVKEVGGVDGNN